MYLYLAFPNTETSERNIPPGLSTRATSRKMSEYHLLAVAVLPSEHTRGHGPKTPIVKWKLCVVTDDETGAPARVVRRQFIFSNVDAHDWFCARTFKWLGGFPAAASDVQPGLIRHPKGPQLSL